MEALTPWLTPALLIALFAWLRADIREQRRDLAALARDMTKRFDEVSRELADLRERMAKLEGSLDGFLAGRRDRDVA